MINRINRFLAHFHALGFLILRIGIGVSMVLIYGGPKLLAGPDRWHAVGLAMSHFGITFFPTFWGFLAALAESVGSIFLALGLYTRLAAFFLAFTMTVAFFTTYPQGPQVYAHPLQLLFVFIAFICTGAGKHSLDHALKIV